MIPNSKLMRHIASIHKKEERVQVALSSNKELFETFRVEGILEHNMKETSSENPQYQRERKADNNKSLSKCSECDKCLFCSNFFRHKRVCKKRGVSRSSRKACIQVGLLKDHTNISPDFRENILNKFRDDEIGRLCCSDKTIVQLEQIFYSKIRRKKDKRVQVCKQNIIY